MFKLCWHDWSRYGKLLDARTSWNKRQMRECSKCGKITFRTLRVNDAIESTTMMEGIINDI